MTLEIRELSDKIARLEAAILLTGNKAARDTISATPTELMDGIMQVVRSRFGITCPDSEVGAAVNQTLYSGAGDHKLRMVIQGMVDQARLQGIAIL